MDSVIDRNNSKWHKENHKIKRLREKQERQLTDCEYASYLKELRLHDEKKTGNGKNQMNYFFLLHNMMRLYRSMAGIKIVKLSTQMSVVSDHRSVIFVITHVGKEDITVFNEVTDRHYTILSGDYESLHCRLEGLLMSVNGVLFFDMRSKQERTEIEERVASVLKRGDSVLCSMEAAWNISPNEIVQRLFSGMIRVAMKTNAVIIPIGIERFSKKMYGINISKYVFDPFAYISVRNSKEQLSRATDTLRPLLAEVKYELYFDENIRNRITISRKSIGDYETYYERWKKDILQEWTFTEKAIEEKKYRDFEKPEYAYAYVIDRYKSLFRNQKLDAVKYAELLADLNNSVYPDRIHKELKKYVIMCCNNFNDT